MSGVNKTLPTILIKGGTVVNEGKLQAADVLIKGGRIERIGRDISHDSARIIDAAGLHVMPGIIDDQVHFREPGLTQKADIQSEARAAVAGGVTSFMEMPNTKPPALTQEILQQKYDRAAQVSPANYSFFMGASNDNLEEVLKTDHEQVCGVKVFMGSSTGNMLVDDDMALRKLFSQVSTLIAAHCEDEQTVRDRTELYLERYGDNIPMSCHPEIRDVNACYLSSSKGAALAREFGTRFHILHISTAEEIPLFDNTLPLRKKKLTSEVCVHHLYFTKDDYAALGSGIKCNPAIKEARHSKALFQALLDNHLDIIATDHAPHTKEEKAQPYGKAPSGVPLIQHSLNIMLEFHARGMISLERIVEKMCHAPAECFRMRKRGYIREGYWADLALVDVDSRWTVHRDNLLYKCQWSPLEGKEVCGKVVHTLVNGHPVWSEGKLNEAHLGQRLLFEKDRL